MEFMRRIASFRRGIESRLRLRPWGCVDSPSPGEKVPKGSLSISGWCVDRLGKISGIIVTVNGEVRSIGTTGLARPDVSAALGHPKWGGNAGWEAKLSLVEDPRGYIEIDVLALRINGNSKSIGKLIVEVVDAAEESTPTAVPWHVGNLELPQEGDTIPKEVGSLFVKGWALQSDGPVQGIIVEVNGRSPSRLLLNLERPDVEEIHRHIPGARYSGWEAEFGVDDKTAAAFVKATVVGCQGQSASLGQRRVSFSSGAISEGHLNIELPQPVAREVLPIRGWGLVCSSMPRQVELLVDGRSVGYARLGIPRPDIGELYNCPDALICGFESLINVSSVPLHQDSVAIAAILTGWNGEQLSLSEVEVTLQKAPVSHVSEHQGRIDELRSRFLHHISCLDPSRQREPQEVRLLAFTHDLGYGGGQLYLHELLTGLIRKSDFSCTVVAPQDGPLRPVLEEKGIRVHITSGYPVNDYEQYESKVLELALWAHVHHFNAALVNTMGAFTGADVANRLDIPCVWAIHESFEPPIYWNVAFPPGYLDPHVRRQAEEALAKVETLVFESESTRQQYKPYARPGSTQVISYGIDIAEIATYRNDLDRHAVRARLGVRESDRVILCVGTVEPRKGQTRLARAFCEVVRHHPNAVLALVGDREGIYSEALHSYRRRSSLEERILIVPVIPEVYQWYAAADAFICASDVESLPRSLLEAMAFGLPVIAAEIFGIPEVITSGTTGYLFDPDDLLHLVEVLKEALDAEDGLTRAGESALEYVTENHRSEGYVNAYAEILRTLGKSERPSR